MTATVIKTGTAITFAVTSGENGAPVSADTVELSVLNDTRQIVWEAPAPIAWADAVANGVTFPEDATDEPEQAYRLFRLRYMNGVTEVISTYYEVIIEPAVVLQPFKNSFATYGQLSLVARTISGLTGFQCCSAGGGSLSPSGDGNPTLTAAYINAFHNIGYVTVDFYPPKHRARWRDQSRMWDGDGIFDPDVAKVSSTRQLTPELWAELKPWQQEALIRAQVIEANFLLSGNTVEKQRYSGLLSHSAGESAHFYRSFKPFEGPVSKATLNALKGIVTYVTRIGG